MYKFLTMIYTFLLRKRFVFSTVNAFYLPCLIQLSQLYKPELNHSQRNNQKIEFPQGSIEVVFPVILNNELFLNQYLNS